MMDWSKQASVSDFFVNTPANMSIYISRLMCEHMANKGGIEYYEKLAEKKANLLYDFIDNSLEVSQEKLKTSD